MRDWAFLGCPAIVISLFVWGTVHPRSHWRATVSWRSLPKEEPSAGFLLFHRLLNIAGLVALVYFPLFEFPALLDCPDSCLLSSPSSVVPAGEVLGVREGV